MTKIGIIGAGQWSAPYALAAANAGAEVSGVYAPDDSAANLAERVGASAAASPEDLISGADCVLLGSPTHTHADYIEMLAESGKPVLCASPVAVSEADLEKIARASMGKTNLYASFPLRSRPEFQRLKLAMDAGDLGKLGIVRLGRCLPKPEGWRADVETSGGALMESGVHLVDALSWLAGPVVRIYGGSPESDLDYTVLVARLADGSIAHLEVSWAEAEGVAFDYYEAAGTNGLLEFDSRNAPLMRVERRGAQGAEVVLPGASVAEHELRAFLKVAAGGAGEFSTVEEAVEVCRRVLKIKDAVESDTVLMLA